MFDLSSSWMEGSHCELAARGYSRDGKKGKTQIEYGLLTDAEGGSAAAERGERLGPGRRPVVIGRRHRASSHRMVVSLT